MQQKQLRRVGLQAADKPKQGFGEAMRALVIVEQAALAIAVQQGEIDMRAAALQVRVAAGHERGRQAALLGEGFNQRFEQGGVVGDLQAAGRQQGGLHQRVELVMQTFHRHIHRLADGLDLFKPFIGGDLLRERVEGFEAGGGAKTRGRCLRRRARGVLQHIPFGFKRAAGRHAHRLVTPQLGGEQGAAAIGAVFIRQLADQQQAAAVLIQREVAARGGVQSQQAVAELASGVEEDAVTHLLFVDGDGEHAEVQRHAFEQGLA